MMLRFKVFLVILWIGVCGGAIYGMYYIWPPLPIMMFLFVGVLDFIHGMYRMAEVIWNEDYENWTGS